MKQWYICIYIYIYIYIYMCVCVSVCLCACVYIIYKALHVLFFRYTDCLFLSVFKVVILMLRAITDAYVRKLKWKFFFFVALKTLIFSFFILSFPSISSDYKRVSLQHLLLIPDIVGLWCFASCQVMMFCESFFFLFCLKIKILWQCKRSRVRYLEKRL